MESRIIEALRAEYVNGVPGAVGDYLDGCDIDWEFVDELEQRMRSASHPETELVQIERELILAKDLERVDDSLFIKASAQCSPCPTAVEEFIRGNSSQFPLVACLGGFVISGMEQQGCQVDVEQVFNTAVSRFRRLLYNDDESIRNPTLLDSLAKHLTFCCGKMSQGLADVEDCMPGAYCMTMKCDEWPFNPDWKGTFPASEVKHFTSSLWRPRRMCAVWEETFHTITEGYNRLSRVDPCYADWDFGEGSLLGNLMQADIDAGSYDIEEQNTIEQGEYDFETAVNEYVHQCWLTHYAGHKGLLLGPKAQVVQLMECTPGMPLCNSSSICRW